MDGQESRNDGHVDSCFEAVVSVSANLIHIEAELCDDEIGASINFMTRMFDLFIVRACADEIRCGWFSVLMVAFWVTGDGDAECIGEIRAESCDEFSGASESVWMFFPIVVWWFVTSKRHQISDRCFMDEIIDDMDEFIA